MLVRARRSTASIATNTTIAREAVGDAAARRRGGRPVRAAGVREVERGARARSRSALDGALPIIGVGGILSGDDAKEKIDAGATLVQIYTGLIYRGPDLVAECVRRSRKLGSDRKRSPAALLVT